MGRPIPVAQSERVERLAEEKGFENGGEGAGVQRRRPTGAHPWTA